MTFVILFIEALPYCSGMEVPHIFKKALKKNSPPNQKPPKNFCGLEICDILSHVPKTYLNFPPVKFLLLPPPPPPPGGVGYMQFTYRHAIFAECIEQT